MFTFGHGLRTPGEEIAFTSRPKINSHSQIFRYGRSIFCLPHRPKFSGFFDLCLHWVSVVRAFGEAAVYAFAFLLKFCKDLQRCFLYIFLSARRYVHENELSSLTFHLILTDFFCFWDAGQSGCSVCGMTIFCYPLHFLLIPPKVECKVERCLHKTWLTKNF